MKIQRYRVIILAAAFAELDDIFEFVKQHSSQNAVAIIDRLFDAAKSLEYFPHRYKIHQHRRGDFQTVRSMPADNYIIYYRVNEQFHVVKVLSFRDGRRRQPRRFR